MTLNTKKGKWKKDIRNIVWKIYFLQYSHVQHDLNMQMTELNKYYMNRSTKVNHMNRPKASIFISIRLHIVLYQIEVYAEI